MDAVASRIMVDHNVDIRMHPRRIIGHMACRLENNGRLVGRTGECAKQVGQTRYQPHPGEKQTDCDCCTKKKESGIEEDLTKTCSSLVSGLGFHEIAFPRGA